MAETYTIGIDLGGTNIKGGICAPDGTLVVRHMLATEGERGPEHVLARMAGLVGALLRTSGVPRQRILAVGVGAPGPMSQARGVIHHAPNLPGFVDLPLRERFSALIDLPVVLENDANAAAYGEFAVGAGRGVRDMVMLTLGTGIGGGVVLDGRLWRGRFDNAGEVGHTIVVLDGRPCPCGQRGCLERYASANAVAERVEEAIRAGADSRLRARVEAGERLDAQDVLQAVEQGDELATRIWEEMCRYLGLAAVNLQHVVNPELIVFAGGLINAGDRLLVPVRREFERLSWRIAPDAPRLVLATLGNDAGTVGAALLARVNHAGG